MSETVTIVLSNYNHGKYLPDSLKNICEQTRPADKILVIDDGSTDNSVAVIEDFERLFSNLRLIRNPVNIGLQASIAKVLPLLVTDCMVWSASDDILLPNFLEKSMAALERHPTAGMVFSELTVLKGDTGVTQRFATEASVKHIYDLRDLPEYANPEAVRARMAQSYFPPTSNSVVVRLWALKKVGYFRPALEWHSDWLAYNAVAVKFGSCVIPETLALIRERADSYSAEGRRAPEQQARVLNAMLDVIAEPGFEDVKTAFEAHPSYYKVWGREILPILRRKRGFLRTYINYRRLLTREFRRDNGLSFKHYLISKIPVLRIGFFRRPLPPAPARPSLVGQMQAANEWMRVELEKAKHIRDLRDQKLTEVMTDRDRFAVLVGEINTKLTNEVGKNETLVASLSNSQRLLEGLRRELEQAKAALSAMTSAHKKSETENRSLTDQIETLQSSFATDIENQRKQLKTLEDSLQATREREQEVSAAFDAFKCDPAWAETTTKLTEERDSLIRQLGDMRSERDEAISSLEIKEQQAKEDQAAIRSELSETSEALKGMKTELNATQTLCENLKTRLSQSGVRSILLTSMPKSGTYFISKYLSTGLITKSMIVSNQYFPNDVIRRGPLLEFIKGNCVSEDHFDGSPANIRHLETVTDRIVVHIRDPRQATLSYIHFLNTGLFRDNQEYSKSFVVPTLPDNFFEMNFAEQLDWGIKEWLPLLIEWVDSWRTAQQTSRLDVKFTHFESMVQDEKHFFEDLMSFFGVPQERFQEPILGKKADIHFRRGLTDEWMDVFTPEQKQAANQMIPLDFCTQFGWQSTAPGPSHTVPDSSAGTARNDQPEPIHSSKKRRAEKTRKGRGDHPPSTSKAKSKIDDSLLDGTASQRKRKLPPKIDAL